MSNPQYSPTPGSPYAPAGGYGSERTNVLAIIALIGAFVVPLAGIICGHIALAQIKRTGEKGRGLALAGTILGYVFVVLGILFFLLAFVLAAASSGVSTS